LPKKNQDKGTGLHKFFLLFAVLPQHLQINLGFDVKLFTLSKSNLPACLVNWHILWPGILLQLHAQSSSQHLFSILEKKNPGLKGYCYFP
jgi:hypothetical protein